MAPRPLRPLRLVALLAVAFACGGGSAEVAVRTQRAIARVRAERQIGSAGQLVALSLSEPGGDVIARPRLICPVGKEAELVLHDPLHPADVRLSFRVAATREPSGEISLDWSLTVPERSISERGTLSLTPGVEQSVSLGDGALLATWLAVPVPSAAFDAYLDGEARRPIPRPI